MSEIIDFDQALTDKDMEDEFVKAGYSAEAGRDFAKYFRSIKYPFEDFKVDLSLALPDTLSPAEANAINASFASEIAKYQRALTARSKELYEHFFRVHLALYLARNGLVS